MKMSRVKTLLITALACVALFNLSCKGQTIKNISENQNSIFPKGEKAPAEYFTGTVWVRSLVPDDTTFNCLISNVTFEPGARTNWHKHPAGQILLVTEGTGYYQEKGKPIQLLHKGDVVKCLPNVEHWHGASPDSRLTHIAINPNTENGIVVWLRKVSDEEYHKVK
jgi:quercetin dioxygenase-like cupin family protein